MPPKVNMIINSWIFDWIIDIYIIEVVENLSFWKKLKTEIVFYNYVLIAGAVVIVDVVVVEVVVVVVVVVLVVVFGMKAEMAVVTGICT